MRKPGMGTPVENPSGKRHGRLITIAIVTVLVLLVIWQNSQTTTLSILFFDADLPLMVWLGGFLGIGFLLGVTLMWSHRRRQ
ncbi:LapA family protein [Dokdonella sp.]|uniref:LapA family protein n=1 Tax=Dokdonella sp. TaxID=2291710 RepID=UPI003528FAE4